MPYWGPLALVTQNFMVNSPLVSTHCAGQHALYALTTMVKSQTVAKSLHKHLNPHTAQALLEQQYQCMNSRNL